MRCTVNGERCTVNGKSVLPIVTLALAGLIAAAVPTSSPKEPAAAGLSASVPGMVPGRDTCMKWSGFPDCGVVEIKALEDLLNRAPNREEREQILLRMAQDYYFMAYLWTYGNGEHSEKWSDLFRQEGLKMALALEKSVDPAIRQEAAELARKCNDGFSRPIAPAPAGVLAPDYL